MLKSLFLILPLLGTVLDTIPLKKRTKGFDLTIHPTIIPSLNKKDNKIHQLYSLDPKTNARLDHLEKAHKQDSIEEENNRKKFKQDSIENHGVRLMLNYAKKPYAISGMGATGFIFFNTIKKKQVATMTGWFLGEELNQIVYPTVFKVTKWHWFKNLSIFTTIGAFVVSVEESFLPGWNKYLRWGIAFLIATILTVLYHIQKAPKKPS